MIENSDQKHISKIIAILEANEGLIEYDYKGKENQILIPKDLIDKTHIYIQTIKDSNIDFLILTKNAIRQALELTIRDIVICKNGSIFIKLIHKVEKIEVPAEEKNTVLNRYNGFSEEEMKSFYNEFYEDIENKNFFPTIAEDFITTYCIKKKITNDVYEKNVFGYIHNITLEHLINMYEDNSDGFFQGFAGYIFRIHFKEVFEYVADSILDEISMANQYMIEFLNYYASDTIVVGGYKYKVPIIEAQGGLRWNVVSMLSIAKIYTQSAKSAKILSHKIMNMKTDISALYINNLSPVEYHAAFIKNRQTLETNISTANKKLDTYLDSLRVTKNVKEKVSLEKDIQKIEKSIRILREEKKELANKMIQQSSIKKYKILQNDMNILMRELTAKQRIINQNIEAYQSMRNSLVKALTSKKKKI